MKRMKRMIATVMVALFVMGPVVSADAHGRNFRHVWRTQVTKGERDWYRATAFCESRNQPWIRGYYSGAVQWLDSTWASVGGWGRAADHGRHEQAVRAIWLLRRAGTSPWPNCG